MSPEISEKVDEVNRAVTQFKSHYDRRVSDIETALQRFEYNVSSPSPSGPSEHAYGLSFANAKPKATQLTSEQLRSWRQFIRSGDDAGLHSLRAEMSVDDDPSGGYLVGPQVSEQVVRVAFDDSPFRQFANVITLREGDAWEQPVQTSEAAATWASEREARSDSAQPDLKRIRISLHEITAMPKATQKILDTSSFDVDGWLREELARAFNSTEGTSFATGSGSGQPKGILSYATAAQDDDARDFGTLEYIPSGAAGAFKASGSDPENVLYDAIAALKPAYRSGAIWMMNRSTEAAVRKLKDADGRSLWTPSLQQGRPANLVGFPVAINEDFPDIAADSLSIGFGNLQRAYTIVDGVGLRVLRDPFTDKPYVKFYTTKRTGGGLVDSLAFKVIKFASS